MKILRYITLIVTTYYSLIALAYMSWLLIAAQTPEEEKVIIVPLVIHVLMLGICAAIMFGSDKNLTPEE